MENIKFQLPQGLNNDAFTNPSISIKKVQINAIVVPILSTATASRTEQQYEAEYEYLDLREYPNELEKKCEHATHYVNQEQEKVEDMEDYLYWEKLRTLLKDHKWEEFVKERKIQPMDEEIVQLVMHVFDLLEETGGREEEEEVHFHSCIEPDTGLVVWQNPGEDEDGRYQVEKLTLKVFLKHLETKKEWEEEIPLFFPCQEDETIAKKEDGNFLITTLRKIFTIHQKLKSALSNESN